LAASPWAPLVAVAGHERIYLWDVETRRPVGTLPFPEGVPFVLRFSRDGDALLAAGGRGVESGKAVLFDVRSGKRLAEIGDEKDIVLAADVSADHKLVALGGPGRVVKVFSVPDGKPVYQISKHTDWITALEFSPDGALLATADRSGAIFLWDAAHGSNAGALEGHQDSVTSLDWRGDGKLLASGGEDGQIMIWNAGDGFPVATIAKAHPAQPAPGGVLAVWFAPDGRLVSVGRDATIRTWSADGKPRGASPPVQAMLTKVAGSADGKLLIAGDYSGSLRIWDGHAVTADWPGQ